MSRAKRTMELSEAARQELLRVRDTHPKAYVRERAAAVLKVAAGASVRQVAQHGLLRPRAEETVSGWLDRYQAEGSAGLEVHPGRGRPPAYFPEARDGGSGRGGTGGTRPPQPAVERSGAEPLDPLGLGAASLLAGAAEPLGHLPDA